MGFQVDSSRIPNDIPVVFQSDYGGVPLWFCRVSIVIQIRFTWDCIGMPMGLLSHSKGFQWDLRWITSAFHLNPMGLRFDANPTPLGSQCDSNWIPSGCHWDSGVIPMWDHWESTWIPMGIQIWFKVGSNFILAGSQCDSTWVRLESQWSAHWMQRGLRFDSSGFFLVWFH